MRLQSKKLNKTLSATIVLGLLAGGGVLPTSAGATTTINLGGGTVTSNASGNDASESGAVVIGAQATSNAPNSVAIGAYATTTTDSATNDSSDGLIAIGVNSEATGHYAIAIGANSRAYDNGSDGKSGAIAIGSYSYAGSYSSIAIGAQSYAAGENSIAIGWEANAGDGDYTLAIGKGSAILGDGSNNSIAIGTGTTATKSNAFSVGSSSQTRTIQFVTAGEDDTDAVNVAQLKSGLATKANTDLSNLSEAGKNVIKSYVTTAKTGVKSSDGSITVTTDGDNYDIGLAKDQTFNTVTTNTLKTKDLTVTGNTVIGDSTSDTLKVNATTTFTGPTTFNNTVTFNNGLNTTYLNVGGKTYISSTGINANNQKITNVADGTLSANSKDVVNGSQLYTTNQNVAKNTQDIANLRTDVNTNTTNIKNLQDAQDEMNKNKADKDLGNITSDGEQVIKDLASSVDKTSSVSNTDGNLTVTVTKDGNNTNYEINLAKDIKAESYAVGDKVYINKDGINANDQKIINVADGEVSEGSKDAVNGGQLYTVKKELEETLENMSGDYDEQLKGKANIDLDNITEKGEEVIKELARSVDKTAEVTNTDGNLVVTATVNGNTTTYDVNLAKDIKANSYSIGDKTYITKDGINANDQKVINVKAGDISEGSTDAVTGGQLYETNQKVQQNSDDIADLRSKMEAGNNELKSYADTIGSQAAAMASLHPLEYDENDKVSVAASIGSYADKTAGAIGAFYRPDQKSMISVQTSFGSDTNMIGVGVSKSFGKYVEKITQAKIDQMREEVTKEIEAEMQDEFDAIRGEILELQETLRNMQEKQV